MLALLQILDQLLEFATYGILLWIILGWVRLLNLGGPLQVHVVRLEIFLDGVLAPFLRPIRRILPPAGGFDFSPVVLLFALFLFRSFLSRLAYSVAVAS